VVRTRVGYAGGTTEDPTYYNLGDHSETIRIEYDPNQISYEDLLDVFWSSHAPSAPSLSRQYASIIFYHDEEQRQLAQASKEQYQAQCSCQVYTEIIPAPTFYLAEEYHQKYFLRQRPDFLGEFVAIYPDPADFVNSTAVARVNGYLAGYGTRDNLSTELNDLGLSTRARAVLLDIVNGR
jgi:methionine-S-sulfoxide reductase